MTGCFIFSNLTIILTGQWASIGVTRSYSRCPRSYALLVEVISKKKICMAMDKIFKVWNKYKFLIIIYIL